MSKFVQKFRKDQDYDSDYARNSEKKKKIRQERKVVGTNKKNWDPEENDFMFVDRGRLPSHR